MSQLFAGLGWSVDADTAAAVAAAVEQARPGLHGHTPSVAFVTTTVEHDAQRVFTAVTRALPGVAVHGITTSLGLLGGAGVISGPSGVVGVLLLAGGKGVRVATGAAPIAGDPAAAPAPATGSGPSPRLRARASSSRARVMGLVR